MKIKNILKKNSIISFEYEWSERDGCYNITT